MRLITIHFKPILFKKALKKILRRCNFYLDFEKEWRNFLGICENSKIERILSLNNFLITEFLITDCELKPELLNGVNCHCDKAAGRIKIPFENYHKYKQSIKEFLIDFD